MLALMILCLVITASAIIGGVVAWAYRNGTLQETEQERYDRHFADIVRAEGYLR